MPEYRNILVVQTSFLGDVILTLPLLQALKRQFPSAGIDMVVVPHSAELLKNHPDIRDVVVYDKRGADAGWGGFLRMRQQVRNQLYDLALVPHRSLRSAALVAFAGIRQRVGFDTSAGKFLFTNIVHYETGAHEVERNLSLLRSIGSDPGAAELPRLYPSDGDRCVVDNFLSSMHVAATERIICIAPGTIWNTKRWHTEGFTGLSCRLAEEGYQVLLIGGGEDRVLCDEIASAAGTSHVRSSAGMLTILQSAELIRRCRLLVSNDSAPMHLAVAMNTPVVAIFGATIPGFGFAPMGPNDTVVETKGLSCRPCSIHGGNKCPITTFDCMMRISAEQVFSRVQESLAKVQPVRS